MTEATKFYISPVGNPVRKLRQPVEGCWYLGMYAGGARGALAQYVRGLFVNSTVDTEPGVDMGMYQWLEESLPASEGRGPHTVILIRWTDSGLVEPKAVLSSMLYMYEVGSSWQGQQGQYKVISHEPTDEVTVTGRIVPAYVPEFHTTSPEKSSLTAMHEHFAARVASTADYSVLEERVITMSAEDALRMVSGKPVLSVGYVPMQSVVTDLPSAGEKKFIAMAARMRADICAEADTEGFAHLTIALRWLETLINSPAVPWAPGQHAEATEALQKAKQALS